MRTMTLGPRHRYYDHHKGYNYTQVDVLDDDSSIIASFYGVHAKSNARKFIMYKTYTIDEHPNPEACFEYIRNHWHDLGQHALDDMVASLQALAEATGGDLDYSLSIVPDRGENLKITNFSTDTLRDLYRRRDDYPLTGMCYDRDVINALANDALEHSILKVLHDAGEHIYSDEGLRELCEANDYEFYEDGTSCRNYLNSRKHKINT